MQEAYPGNAILTNKFQQRLQNSSLIPRKVSYQNPMGHCVVNGLAGVVEIIVIPFQACRSGVELLD